KRSEVLTDRRGRSIIQRSACPVRAEGVCACALGLVEPIAPLHANIGAEFEAVLAGDLAQAGKKLEIVVRIVYAAAGAAAQTGESAEVNLGECEPRGLSGQLGRKAQPGDVKSVGETAALFAVAEPVEPCVQDDGRGERVDVVERHPPIDLA